MDAEILTLENLEEAIGSGPMDIFRDAKKALLEGRESHIEYALDGVTHFAFFPQACRGAVCINADSDWTDCDSLDDLVDRWANYEERWSS